MIFERYQLGAIIAPWKAKIATTSLTRFSIRVLKVKKYQYDPSYQLVKEYLKPYSHARKEKRFLLCLHSFIVIAFGNEQHI